MTTPALALILAFAFATSAVLALAESSLFSLGAIRLRRLKAKRRWTSSVIRSFLAHPRRLLVTIVIGNTLALTAVSALGTALGARWDETYGPGVAAVVTAALVFVFAEAFPKSFGLMRPEVSAVASAPLVAALEWCLYPVIRAVVILTDYVTGGLPRRNLDLAPEDVFGLLRESEAEGVLDDGERAMIERLVGMGEKTVGEIATPRTAITAFPATMSIAEASRILSEIPYSRVPVYDGELERIVGILHAKDLLLAAAGPASIASLVRPPEFVVASQPSLFLLSDFIKHRYQVAVVVDEYGALDGIVTMSDLLAEITGTTGARIRSLDGRRFEVAADVGLDELNDVMDINLQDDDAETVGGYVINRLGRIPEAGEEFVDGPIRFVVSEAQPHRLNALIVEKIEA